jgi:hypothetical protein
MKLRVLVLLAIIFGLAGETLAQVPPGGYGPGTGSSSGGGLTTVTTLPATCTIGTAVFLTSSATGFPIGQYNCNATNTFTLVGTDPGIIFPANFGVLADGNAVFDATFTNTSNSITSASSKFITGPRPARVGQIVFGTCCGHLGVLNHVGSVIQVPQGTITIVDSDTQIHVSTTANANQSNAALIYGSDDTTAWKNTITAAWGTAGRCLPIFAPGGLSMVQDAMGNTLTCNNAITNSGPTGGALKGTGGRTGTGLVLTPNFNYTNCNGGAAGIACLFSARGIAVDDMMFWGGEVSPLSGTHAKAVLGGDFDTRFNNVLVAGLFAADVSFIGIEMASNYCVYCIVDGAGVTAIDVPAGQQPIITMSYAGDVNHFGLLVSGASTNAQSTASGYGPVMAANFTGVNVQTGAILNSVGDRTLCYTSGGRVGANFSFQVASTAFISQLNTCIGGAGNTNDVGLKVTLAGSKAYVSESNLIGGGTGGSLVKTADSSAIFNLGGVVVQGTSSGYTPTCSSTGASQTACTVIGTNEFGSITVTAGVAASATGTVTLTFAGTPSINGTNAPICQFTYDNTGTGSWLVPVALTLGTQSNTASIVNWGATALTSASTYKMGYSCIPR